MPALWGCRGWRPPRTVLIAAAFALALAAFFYCRGGGRHTWKSMYEGANRESSGNPARTSELAARSHPVIRATSATPAESSREDIYVRMRTSQEAVARGKEDREDRPDGASDKTSDIGRLHRRVLSSSFFSRMQCRFTVLMSKGSIDINTRKFLECCSELSEFFDLFGMSVFRTARNAIDDNIKTINQSYMMSSDDSKSLREFILGQKKSNESSATVALLWLNRGLEFIAKFMTELEVQSSLYSAGWSAYERTLRPYHGLFLRTTFSVALRMAPYRETFLLTLAFAGEASSVSARGQKLTADLEKALFDEIRDDMSALQRCCTAIKDFYKLHNLGSEAVA